jgi:hypothetical protein
MDAMDLHNWLLCFGAESEALRDSLAGLAKWLANEHPLWAAYRPLMACQLVALNKCPGVQPVGIGKVYRHLMAKCLLEVAGHQATAAAGNLNLCTGLPTGIEGAIHAVQGSITGPPIHPEPIMPLGPDPLEGLLTHLHLCTIYVHEYKRYNKKCKSQKTIINRCFQKSVTNIRTYLLTNKQKKPEEDL